MANSVQWENIVQEPPQAGLLQRAKVLGGWLVRETQDVMTQLPDGRTSEGYEWRVSLTFIPDPNHVWLNEGATNA